MLHSSIHPTLPPPPLVRGSKLHDSNARLRLRGPVIESLPEDHAAVLTPVPTTVADSGVVRFGDSLLLLNHGTEVLLQADISRTTRVVDTSHTQQKEFDAHYVTTGKILQPCARNSFSVARADRKDEFGDSLEVHYGQVIRILASGHLSGTLLYLHLHSTPASVNESLLVLLPRATKASLWRVIPRPQFESDNEDTSTESVPRNQPTHGQALLINEAVGLEHVETGYLLMSDLILVNTGFGMECDAFVAEGVSASKAMRNHKLNSNHASWSFVNDSWVDAVAEVESARTGGKQWKEDKGDDFDGSSLPQDILQEVLAAFKQMRDDDIASLEKLHASIVHHPDPIVCQRIFAALRSNGFHGVRKVRRMCISADFHRNGVVTADTFQGILAAGSVRLRPGELDELQSAFGNESNNMTLNYSDFFLYLAGRMSAQRLEVISRAYRKLQLVTQGSHVRVDDLMQRWSPSCYPQVVNGSMYKEDAYRDFLSQWEVCDHDGHVTPEDFMDYYRDVSASLEESTEFVNMMKVAWDL